MLHHPVEEARLMLVILFEENDCVWCMACISVRPQQAIKVEKSNLEFHEKTLTYWH